MIKLCVVCGGEFEANGNAQSCSEACREERRLACRRLERARYRATRPDTVKAQKARHRAKKRAAYLAAHPEVIERKTAREAAIAAAMARKVKNCVECGAPFISRNNVKTCSEECWLGRHRRLRGRPEENLAPAKRLRTKREAQNELNDQRRAAHKLVNELLEKGLEALL